MMRVKVLIPFLDKVTGESRKADDIIEVSEERLAEIKAVNVNMVLVLGEVEETEDEVEETEDEVEEEPIEEPKPKAKKQKTTK